MEVDDMSRVDDRRDKKDWVRREQLALLKLTDQQRKLCESYIRNMDKAVAMTEAGYWVPKTRGPKQLKFIEMNFERYISPPDVQRYLLLLKESVASRLGISMDDIIDEFRAMAFTNMDDYVSWSETGMTITNSQNLTRAQMAGVVQITETTTREGKTIKFKLHNKQPALDRLYEILKELESIDRSAAARPHTISQTQINLILGDPVLRRAVENLAEHMGERPVKLVGQDQHKIEFDRQIESITSRLLDKKEPKRMLTTPVHRLAYDEDDDEVDDNDAGAGMDDDELIDDNEGDVTDNGKIGEGGDCREYAGTQEAPAGGAGARRAQDGSTDGGGDDRLEAAEGETSAGQLSASQGRSDTARRKKGGGKSGRGDAEDDSAQQPGRYDDIDGL
jgi:phage terminase small subunit